MEPKFQNSFIPKAPIQSDQGKIGTGRKQGVNFFMLIAIIVFITSILLAGGVYAYKITLIGAIDSQFVNLEKARAAFEPSFIAEATRLNSRIVNANKLLNEHIAPSAIFDLLEEFTLQTISFKNFSFKDGEDGAIEIRANGEGNSFSSVVLQSDKFGETGYLRDVIFSDLAPNEAGNVNFSFKASLNPNLLLYRRGVRTVQSVPSINPEAEAAPEEDFGVFGNN